MPIDFSRIAAEWLTAWSMRQRQLDRALTLLGPWLAERLEKLAQIERSSRGWPTYAFEGRALSVRLAPAQIGIVQPYGSTGAAVAAPFVTFGRSFARIGQAVEDEWVLPNMLDAVVRVVNLINASIDRWMKPRAEQFDPARVTGSDLFGMMAMAWRELTASLPRLHATATEIRDQRERLWPSKPTTPTSPTTPATPATAALGGSMFATLERYIVGAILVLPILPSWLENLARAGWITARVRVLDTLQSIETRVFGLRTQVLSKILVDLPRLLRDVPAMAAAMGAMLAWSIRYFARLAQVWMDVIVFALNLFLSTVQALANAVIGLINGFLALIQTIMEYDLLTFIKPLLGPAGMLIDMLGVRVSLDDLIEAGTQTVNLAAYASIKAAIIAARTAINAAGTQVPLVGHGIINSAMKAQLLRKLSLIEQVVDALFGDTGGPMTETAAPRITSMPDFYAMLVGAPPGEIAGYLRSFGYAMADHFNSLLQEASSTLSRLAQVFDRTAADLARTGPAARMADYGRDTTALVGELYDDQIRGVGERIAARSPSSFERWLVGGGFFIIGAAIPQYVRSMLHWWREEAAVGEGPAAPIHPTSPHILLRRAQLARVHVPRLTLRATGRAHDEALVRELAHTFRGAVQQAYREGERRLAALQPVLA